MPTAAKTSSTASVRISRKHLRGMSAFDINQAIEEVVDMVQAPIDKNRVSVRTQPRGSLTSVHGDRVQLQQVVLKFGAQRGRSNGFG